MLNTVNSLHAAVISATPRLPSESELDNRDWSVLFEVCESREDILNRISDDMIREGYVMTWAGKSLLSDLLEEHLQDSINRHDAPWFSEGLKEELALEGVPVTKADELDDYFAGIKSHMLVLIRRDGPERAASKCAMCVYCDDPYTGNLSGYSANEILESWSRLGMIN